MDQYNQAASQPEQNLFELQVDQQSISYLSETARWAKFLSIVGFVMCGIMVLFSLFFGSIISTFSKISSRSSGGEVFNSTVLAGSSAFSMVYILIALLYFFPCLYLFNFSSKIQTALRNNDQTNLNAAFNNLKSYFKFLGILTIVVLSFYLLGTVIVVSVASMMR